MEEEKGRTDGWQPKRPETRHERPRIKSTAGHTHQPPDSRDPSTLRYKMSLNRSCWMANSQKKADFGGSLLHTKTEQESNQQGGREDQKEAKGQKQLAKICRPCGRL